MKEKKQEAKNRKPLLGAASKVEYGLAKKKRSRRGPTAAEVVVRPDIAECCYQRVLLRTLSDTNCACADQRQRLRQVGLRQTVEVMPERLRCRNRSTASSHNEINRTDNKMFHLKQR